MSFSFQETAADLFCIDASCLSIRFIFGKSVASWVFADVELSPQARLSTAQSLPMMAAPRMASLSVRMTA